MFGPHGRPDSVAESSRPCPFAIYPGQQDDLADARLDSMRTRRCLARPNRRPCLQRKSINANVLNYSSNAETELTCTKCSHKTTLVPADRPYGPAPRSSFSGRRNSNGKLTSACIRHDLLPRIGQGFLIDIRGRSKRVFSKALWAGKVVTAALQDSSKECMSVLACICADGVAVPPALNNQGKTGCGSSSRLSQHGTARTLTLNPTEQLHGNISLPRLRNNQ
jgi:hypothetical protein